MNTDKEKLVKAAGVLALICLAVFGLTELRNHNSYTLQEYAEQNPELAYHKPDTSPLPQTDYVHNMSTSDEQNNAGDKEKGQHILNNSGSDEDVSASGTTENLQNESTEGIISSISTLTGALLNGVSVIEERVTYQESFYYEPLSDNLKRYITGISYPTDPTNSEKEPAISYEQLSYLHIMHYNFEGNPAEGELICNTAIAQDLVEIFYELYCNEYQLESVLLIDEFNGDDTASMEANNSSCFNYRLIEGSTSLSKHALGLAIDINPLYNPYITYNNDGTENVFPNAGLPYADRDTSFPYKIDENDLCYKLFTEHGFTWGGNWNSCKDYQHFQKCG